MGLFCGCYKARIDLYFFDVDVDAAMFLLLLFWGSDDRTGLALGGFPKEVPR